MKRPLPFVLAGALLAGTTAHAAHPVFDLVANRTLAHVQRSGGLVIACGAASFAKYVRFSRPFSTWKQRIVEDGRKVALPSTQATLEVPLTAKQAQAQTIWMRLKSPVRQTVRATAAGKASPAVPLAEGWQTVELKLPAGALVEGESKIVFTFAQSGKIAGLKASAAVEWIQLGGEAPGPETAPVMPDDKGFSFGPGGGFAYYVQVPQGGKLVARGDAGGCAIKVRAQAHGQKPLEGALSFGAPLELAPLQGKVVRLEALAEGACQAAKITQAQLTAEVAPPKVTRDKKPKNVILWVTDSTRGDKFKVINPKTRVETPVMDQFAKRATVFRVGYVQGNESRVSHASLFTGMYPAQHKFISPKAKLNLSFQTLGEVAKSAALATAGFTANGYISKFWGFAEGFDLYKNHIHDGGGLKAADLLAAAKKGFLDTAWQKPFFLYLGTIDAHVSWRPHEPWVSKYDPAPYTGPFLKGLLDPMLDKVIAGKMPITQRDKVRVIAIYDSDVSYTDQQFGELVKWLEEKKLLDDTMIVLTADHGEEMWDHGRIGHGQSLREELVHVPFVIHYPPLFPGGKVVEEGVEVVDVLPTIAEALGVKVPEAVQGESLIGLAQGEGQGYPRPAIASQYELAHTMRLGRWKLWVGGSGDVKLFDAEADALEAENLADKRPIERRFVTDALGLWKEFQGRWKKSRWGVASNHKPQLAQDLEKL